MRFTHVLEAHSCVSDQLETTGWSGLAVGERGRSHELHDYRQ